MIVYSSKVLNAPKALRINYCNNDLRVRCTSRKKIGFLSIGAQNSQSIHVAEVLNILEVGHRVVLSHVHSKCYL